MNAAGGGQAAGAPPVIPIQTCKLPPPRQLGLDETRESLTNWLYLAQNFFSRDDSFSRFVLPAQTWDPAAANFGFVNEGPETRLRRTGPEVAAALDRFFKAMSGFFPFNFLARRFPQSTSFASMKACKTTFTSILLAPTSTLAVTPLARAETRCLFPRPISLQ